MQKQLIIIKIQTIRIGRLDFYAYLGRYCVIIGVVILTVIMSVPTATACPLRFPGGASSANFVKKITLQSGSSDRADPLGVEVDACANLIFCNASIRKLSGIFIL